MNNPVLVEVTRGALVESRHRGAVAVVDSEGTAVLTVGDVDEPVFPRSAVKAIQALPLVASGAADAYGLTDAELALACASHSGEPAHVEAAAAMLAKAGRGEGTLECGCHWPLDQKVARALAESGAKPGALHNNCSGKHAGFVCLACASDVDPAGYVRPEHAVMETVRAALEEVTGATHTQDHRGIDGCSIPTYAIPLPALAYGFAKFGSGLHLSEAYSAAAARIRKAVAANPFMVAGTGRFDTRVMECLGPRVFLKTGAEGVYCASFPELGLGVALKCDDGATRASEAMMAAIIRRFLDLDDKERCLVDAVADATLKNWEGVEVGAVRAVGPLSA
ncbi:asparaginase [Salinarimonas ramus]|uniref:Asparaginase n=1 Tax=Salinarimonas ramus TaxID=690164 RepID=A0A917QKQ2_9HYPH|nr:asparaginase [Salinarimonas ramus]GGK54530.1 asparaginase [Salinarimonas ramus]